MDASVLAAGVAAGVGVAIAMALQSRRSGQLNERLVPLLQERGPMTLPALSEALGMGSFMGRGKVTLALGELVQAGKVETLDAPPGTPQLQKVNHIQYRWRQVA